MPDRIQDYKAAFFRAIGNPIRIRILTELRQQPLSVGELQERLQVQSSNVSQNLAVLRAHGIVVAERDGTRVVYSVEDGQLYEILDAARSMLERRIENSARVFDFGVGS